MTLQQKIITSNAVLTIVTTAVLAFATDTFPGNGFFIMFGVIGVIAGLGCLSLGLIWMMNKDRRFSKAYFLSSSMLTIIGLSCYFFLDKY